MFCKIALVAAAIGVAAPAQAASVEWLALDKRFAEPTVAKLGLLQGMYTKYGQTAAGLSNTLSDVWVQVPCLCL